MNKELEKIIEDHPVVTSEDKLDNAALSRVNMFSSEIKKRAMDLNNFCVNYHSEVKRQAELKECRQKVIASTPKADPNPKTKK